MTWFRTLTGAAMISHVVTSFNGFHVKHAPIEWSLFCQAKTLSTQLLQPLAYLQSQKLLCPANLDFPNTPLERFLCESDFHCLPAFIVGDVVLLLTPAGLNAASPSYIRWVSSTPHPRTRICANDLCRRDPIAVRPTHSSFRSMQVARNSENVRGRETVSRWRVGVTGCLSSIYKYCPYPFAGTLLNVFKPNSSIESSPAL